MDPNDGRVRHSATHIFVQQLLSQFGSSVGYSSACGETSVYSISIQHPLECSSSREAQIKPPNCVIGCHIRSSSHRTYVRVRVQKQIISYYV